MIWKTSDTPLHNLNVDMQEEKHFYLYPWKTWSIISSNKSSTHAMTWCLDFLPFPFPFPFLLFWRGIACPSLMRYGRSGYHMCFKCDNLTDAKRHQSGHVDSLFSYKIRPKLLAVYNYHLLHNCHLLGCRE